ncbi:hypothetical protein CP533_1337 [Ophiocordyceps camponoti-saundersi (nom. inval.)]|nr:hypothetical protein CP533_1337 [Ophiocordyceps camponoti-saundersi (nom. inval.)]
MTNSSPPFTVDDIQSLTDCTVPSQAWLSNNSEKLSEHPPISGLATSIIVFNPAGRVLVIQRASNDSMPNLWEAPGGAVDEEDASILEAAARELREESGLVVSRFRRLVSTFDVFHNRNRSRAFVRLAFLVDVESCDSVRLDPDEHQAFAWATEDDVRCQTLDGLPMPITADAMRHLLLESFRSRRELEAGS